MIKCAIFDLDGTLVDTSQDLGRATAYVLEQFDREAKWTDADYRRFVGNGAKKLLERAFENTLSDEQLDKALDMFKVKYNDILIDNAYVYDGIKEALDAVKQRGVKLAVVTNKPHKSAVKMVEALFGKGYFELITGAHESVAKKPDPFTTNETLKKLGVKPSEAIFFGDSDVDVLTAKNAGVEAVGCSWGFRSFECLLSAAPSAIIDEPKYISKLC
ncbi:MAG: HAD family hydrolase [Eubacterium sp.]